MTTQLDPRRPLDAVPASREDVERRLIVRVPHVLISIRDPGSPKPRLRYHGLRRETMFMAFDDVEPSPNFALPSAIRLMTPDDAAAIWAFVLRHLAEQPDLRAVVVHCEQGMSRSPAVAAGLLLGLGRSAEDLLGLFQPNAHVLAMMDDASPRPRSNGK